MFQSWLYVSHSVGWESTAKERLAQLDVQCRQHNASVGVTGVLLFTGRYFAQLLEGPTPAVDHLRQKISKDLRHQEVTTLMTKTVAERSCEQWSFVTVFNQSTFIERIVAQTIEGDVRRDRTSSNKVLRLLVEYGRVD